MATPVENTSRFIERYIPLVDFLGQSLRPNVEIVLHDLDVPDRSIIAIANSHISGREIGGPVTDFALWFMQQGNTAHVPMMTGYRAVNAEGRVCRSSSYFLRDENDVMRGMLCINVDISEWIHLRDVAEGMLGGSETTLPDKFDAFGGYPGASLPAHADAVDSHFEDSVQPTVQDAGLPVAAPAAAAPTAPVGENGKEVITESLRSNIQNLIDSMLNTALSKQSIPPERMQKEERLAVVKDLEDMGFFILKGGITAAAKRLGVSEPTMYRDLVQVRG